MLVVVREDRVNRALLERLTLPREEKIVPTRVLARGAKIETFVSREAERPGRSEQPCHVERTERRAGHVVPSVDEPWEPSFARHRVSASKQYCLWLPVDADTSATSSPFCPARSLVSISNPFQPSLSPSRRRAKVRPAAFHTRVTGGLLKRAESQLIAW